MPLLNYSTNINHNRTVGEIMQKLAKAGAHQMLQDYSGGVVTALSFKIKTKFGEIAFRLPADVEAVKAVLRKQFPRKIWKPEQAANISWRILKDWVEAQLALIETGMVTVEQVFLPYAQFSKTGETVYEMFERQRYGNLLTDRKET